MPFFRCLLFVPAGDERKLEKALHLEVDGLILDLEDAVGPSRKTKAREMACQTLKEHPGRFFVRVNPATSDYFLGDILSLAGAPAAGLVLAKTESAAHVDRVDWLLGLLERERGLDVGGTEIVPFIESARALEDARAIATASKRVRRLFFGGNDYAADIGVEYGGGAFWYARSRLAAVSRAAGLEPPVDTVNPDFRDLSALADDAAQARVLGFQGKMAIHPAQVEVIRRVFTPTAEEVEKAQKVVAAFEAAVQNGSVLAGVDGKMVEAPHVQRARNILSTGNPGHKS